MSMTLTLAIIFFQRFLPYRYGVRVVTALLLKKYPTLASVTCELKVDPSRNVPLAARVASRASVRLLNLWYGDPIHGAADAAALQVANADANLIKTTWHHCAEPVD